ncbi:E3 ubiquitin protein ligase DRIP2-like [Vitis riparia]|uniref:E3 ubiquitin protein ligase DRIP2-like n=1 Tax=Vitis riparia TaxID=96939 RepID=UPI00155A075B|nr:E3 ubiquitin protein ligase DRIP2-like [Vitis riparia]XP_034691346.1 E3 ubiquitin protein ligase DRIP2-like [Vitis riparia]
MSNQVVKVRRETIAACMTCPLCNKLLRDATTISECLHTFCRKCIYNKISDEELECCPICNTDLGCVPLEKLRPDHNLQDVRAKIFPFKRRKVKAPEVVLPVTLPVKRKERSLSSLVVSTPRVSTQTTMTGRRTKSVARKATALRGSGFSIEKLIKKEEDSVGERPASSSSPETLNKFTQNIRQNSPSAEPSIHSTPNKETENGAESWEGKFDLWKPLNCLVEVANRTKSLKFNSQGSAVKSEPMHVPDGESQVRKTKVKEHGRKSKVQDEKISTTPVSAESVKPKKLCRVRRRRAAAFGELGISPQAVLNAVNNHKRRSGSIWFSLVASEDQEGDASLPQISSNFLRIKDVNVPVSFIQKYLMRKLDLTSEAEVEIKCMGQPVLPTLQLHNLVDLWLQTASTSQRVPASIGSSGKEFVMVLAYARRLLDP